MRGSGRRETGPPNCRRRKIRCESPTSLPPLSQEYNHRVKRRSISQHPAQKWQKNLINGSPISAVNPSLAKLMGHPVLLHLQSSPPDIMAEQQRRRLWSEQFLASCTSLISLIHLRLSLPPSLIPFGPPPRRPHHKLLWSNIARKVVTG